jgi:hypothetical protein
MFSPSGTFADDLAEDRLMLEGAVQSASESPMNRYQRIRTISVSRSLGTGHHRPEAANPREPQNPLARLLELQNGRVAAQRAPCHLAPRATGMLRKPDELAPELKIDTTADAGSLHHCNV